MQTAATKEPPRITLLDGTNEGGQLAFTEKALNKVMAQKLGIPEVSIRRFPVDPQAVKSIPESLARAHRVAPLCFNAGALAVAMEKPLNRAIIQVLTVVSQMSLIASIKF